MDEKKDFFYCYYVYGLFESAILDHKNFPIIAILCDILKEQIYNEKKNLSSKIQSN